MRVINKSNFALHCMFVANCDGLFKFLHIENIQTF